MRILILFSLWIAIAYLSLKICRSLFIRSQSLLKEETKTSQRLLNNLKEENERIIYKKESLDKRSFALIQIYETIKKMSGLLKTEEILSMFSTFLNENIDFSSCSLAILSLETEEDIIKKLYEIEKDSSSFKEIQHDKIEKKSRDFINLSNKSQIINKDNTDIIPLIVEGKTIAVLLIKDFKKEYLEDFFILTSQLAMELKKVSLYESVEKLSITDGLTEIYLRRYFIDRLCEEIKRSERLRLKFSILMIDMDHFKNCNDKYGHMVGDAVLKEITSLIINNIREIDLAARYGGEEFTVLLPETGKEGALHVAERIRKAIGNQLISAYDENLNLTVSIGVSIYPENAKTPKTLIEIADKAMYQSKQDGRNLVTVWQGNG